MKYQKMGSELKELLRQAVLQLRFKTTEPTTDSLKYRGYGKIAKSVRLTPYEVQHICRKATKTKKALSAKRLLFQLD
jgi:hypothetical protein